MFLALNIYVKIQFFYVYKYSFFAQNYDSGDKLELYQYL